MFIPGLEEEDIVEKGRLGPGQMINVDLVTGEFKDNIKIKSEIASRKSLCYNRSLFVDPSPPNDFFTHYVELFNLVFLRPSLWRVDCKPKKGYYEDGCL